MKANCTMSMVIQIGGKPDVPELSGWHKGWHRSTVTDRGIKSMRLQSLFSLLVFAVLPVVGCGPQPESPVQQDGAMSKQDNDEPFAEVEVDGEKIIIVPSSESDERVTQTSLSTEGSEDVSHLLTLPTRASGERNFNEDRDYRPDDNIDWVIDVRFEDEPIFEQSKLRSAFDYPWLDANGRPTIYGYSPDTGHWTYLVSADSPATFTKLAFSWSLFDPIADDDAQVRADTLDAYQAEVANRASQLGQPTLTVNRSSQEAERVSRHIRRVVEECNREVAVVPAAPRGTAYTGRDLWDVMMCLGLRWGDMDLFHWENPSGVGDDFLFSVWTSTPPGYFFPEEIAAGQVRVHDLVFGYSIPRSADPAAVFDSMMKAVRYSQKRLGGEILDPNGRPFDQNATKPEIDETVRRLKEAGFCPGEGSTLRVF